MGLLLTILFAAFVIGAVTIVVGVLLFRLLMGPAGFVLIPILLGLFILFH